MRISVVIPAHNEERYIGSCIDSINNAQKILDKPVEIIVVLNRCDDRTEEIALSKGAKVVVNNIRSIAAVRNEGIKVATGDIIATMDGDSIMTQECLVEIDTLLSSGKYIGGGANIKFNRKSFPLYVTETFIKTAIKITGYYSGIFWAYRESFNVIGGFSEDIVLGEDLDLAKKLITYGKNKGMKYGCLKKGNLITSARKFDHYGDWMIFKIMIKEQKKIAEFYKNGNREFVDEYFYDFKHKKLD